MIGHLRKYPLFVLILMISALSMTVPAVHAAKLGEWDIMRTFFSYAAFILIISVISGLALMNRTPRITARSHLITRLLVYIVIPVFLALPFIADEPGAVGEGPGPHRQR